jgi:hypothetical protein
VDDSVVHIFWDHSNLFARMQDTCDDRKGGGLEPGHRLDARLSFPTMYEFAHCGRKVNRMLKKGWGVEVLSFSNGFSTRLQQIARGTGGRGKYVRLDPWYFSSSTFRSSAAT